MRKVMIVGATSAIAEQTARIFSEAGDHVFLVARSEQRLQQIADDLNVRGAASANYCVLDANDFDQHESVITQAEEAMGGLDTVLIAHGTLSDQAACQESVELTMSELRTNALSIIAMCTVLGNRFEQQKNGVIAVISSVAGDRGRQSNYVYGTAKAAVTTFLSGLRNRLEKSGVHVVTIKPGFVDTPMTASIVNKGALWATPEAVAKGIVKAIEKKKNTVYLPGFWRLIMFVICAVPEFVFKKLSL